jgi:hypothetical protein
VALRAVQERIVRGQEYICSRRFGTRQVQGVVCTEAERFQLRTTLFRAHFERHGRSCALQKCLHPVPAFRIGVLPDPEDQDVAPDPAPFAAIDVPHDEQYGFRPQSDAILGLVVERPVQAAGVQVDSNHPLLYTAPHSALHACCAEHEPAPFTLPA